MKNGIKMTAVLLLSSAAFLSAAGTVSAATGGSLSAGTSIKRTVLVGEAPDEGCDVNGDGTVDVLDLMRLKFDHLNPADPYAEADDITRSVGQMYKRITGKYPETNKLNAIVQDIRDSKMTFEEVAFGLAESDEFAAVKTSGEELVKDLYSGLMDREPSEDEMKSALESLESGADKADLLRKIAVTESFFDTYNSRGLGSHVKRIGSNYKKGDTWMHLEPSGKTYPVKDEVLLKLLDSCGDILRIRGTGVDDIYSYCIANSGYKYMEKTRTLEEIEEKGWTYFADYAIKNYFSVCYYMAAEMDILLEQAGYQCRVVHATHGSGDHYWNQIYLNGTWTNYDVTNRWRNYTWEQMYEAGDYVILGYVRPEYK